jgi:hypothetical protein
MESLPSQSQSIPTKTSSVVVHLNEHHLPTIISPAERWDLGLGNTRFFSSFLFCMVGGGSLEIKNAIWMANPDGHVLNDAYKVCSPIGSFKGAPKIWVAI